MSSYSIQLNMKVFEFPSNTSGHLYAITTHLAVMATGLETSISCLCLCQRIPVVKNMKAEELKWYLALHPHFKLHPYISYRIQLGKISLVFTTYQG